MWSYYGSKTNIVSLYPKPVFDTVIEPFAGAGKYSLKHFDKQVILYDKYEVIIKIWHHLQQASVKDILSLPRLKRGETLMDYKQLSEGERLLMGFIIAKGGQSPRNTPSPNATTKRPNTINYQLQNISKQLFKIRHWKIVHGSYDNIENIEATYFIDPPYQFGGHVYNESNKNINFGKLKDWCKSRNGQIIVCENTKADWMDFKPVVSQKGSMFRTTEAIWSNFPTSYDTQQTSLFV